MFIANTGDVSISSTTAGSANAGALVLQGGISAGNTGSAASYFGGAVTVAGAGSFTTADATQTLRIKGATGMLRVAGYVDGTNGAVLYSLNNAENAYIPLSANASEIFLNIAGTPKLTIGTTGAATFAGAVTVTGGATVNGGNGTYGGGALLLGGSGGGSVNAIYTTDTGAVGIYSDHRGTSNTGLWYWRNGTGAANERMRLEATGNLVVAGAVSVSGTAATFTSGTGSPESVKTAPVGSLYTRTDGGASTTLYVKESGAGNTGWIAK